MKNKWPKGPTGALSFASVHTAEAVIIIEQKDRTGYTCWETQGKLFKTDEPQQQKQRETDFGQVYRKKNTFP